MYKMWCCFHCVFSNKVILIWLKSLINTALKLVGTSSLREIVVGDDLYWDSIIITSLFIWTKTRSTPRAILVHINEKRQALEKVFEQVKFDLNFINKKRKQVKNDPRAKILYSFFVHIPSLTAKVVKKTPFYNGLKTFRYVLLSI